MRNFRIAGAALVALGVWSTPAQAYELLPVAPTSGGSTLTFNNATAYRAEVRRAVRAFNAAGAGVRLVRTRDRRAADIRIGYMRSRCGRRIGEGGTGFVRIARGCSRPVATHAALHELGHALGLGHEESKCSAMNGLWIAGKPERCRSFSWAQPLQPDDVAGLRAVWGDVAPVIP